MSTTSPRRLPNRNPHLAKASMRISRALAIIDRRLENAKKQEELQEDDVIRLAAIAGELRDAVVDLNEAGVACQEWPIEPPFDAPLQF